MNSPGSTTSVQSGEYFCMDRPAQASRLLVELLQSSCDLSSSGLTAPLYQVPETITSAFAMSLTVQRITLHQVCSLMTATLSSMKIRTPVYTDICSLCWMDLSLRE